MPQARRAAALVAAAVTALTALTAPAAVADTSPSTTAAAPAGAHAGLYGAGDPTYDGVWRQAFAIRAVSDAGYVADEASVGWLLKQQCADGGWPSYRADTAKPCAVKAEDTNATAAAVSVLLVIPGSATIQQALNRGRQWLRTVQNADGGWSYNPGGPSDPDSTALGLGALGHAAATEANAHGKSPYDALRGFQFGCTAPTDVRGAFGYPDADGKLKANAKATADALNGMHDALLTSSTPAQSTPSTPQPSDCAADPKAYGKLAPQAVGQAAADWLARQIRAGGGHLNLLTPGADTPSPDFGTTADAVTALAPYYPVEAKTAYAWLTAHGSKWAKGSPAALAQLVRAAGFLQAERTLAGAADPLQQLIALGPGATKRATGAQQKPAVHKKADDGGLSGSTTTWIVVGVVFVASVGVGMLLRGRRRRQA
jgi:hypothetical protein